jgi:hypothetical protein
MDFFVDKEYRALAISSNPYRQDWQDIFCAGVKVDEREGWAICEKVLCHSVYLINCKTSGKRIIIPENFTDSPSLCEPNNQDHY